MASENSGTEGPLPDPYDWLDEAAEARWAADLQRALRVHDRRLVNFGSNDYLGLASDPRLAEAAAEAAWIHGWGAGASPLVTGWHAPHEALAADLAEFEEVEAVALFPTGFAANLGTIGALVGSSDAVYLDRLNHASLIDGARLSGASVRVFPHRDADRLDAILARERRRFRRVLIATDGVFSMDGDLAPLAELAEIADRHGAMLLIDEAHATGVIGPDGRGSAAACGLDSGSHVRVGTLSKALGSLGGFAAGSARVVRQIVNAARPLIYSTGLPPAAASAAREALRISRVEPWRRARVIGLGDRLRGECRVLGLAVVDSTGPIVPLTIGDPTATLRLADALLEAGMLVPAIRPPTVPRGTSRLRVSLSASHRDEDLSTLMGALRSITRL